MKTRIATVAKIVCREFDVTKEQLESKNRMRKFSIARHAFYYLCHKHGHSLKKIGMWLGDRDHTTVMHGKRIAETAIGIDRLNKIESEIIMYNNNFYRLEGEDNDAR